MSQDAAISVHLEGALSVPRADSIQGRILAALDSGSPVVIDVRDATDIDISFLQILVAAQKTAAARAIPLSVTHRGSRLLDEAARCGLAVTSSTGVRILPQLVPGQTQ